LAAFLTGRPIGYDELLHKSNCEKVVADWFLRKMIELDLLEVVGPHVTQPGGDSVAGAHNSPRSPVLLDLLAKFRKKLGLV